MRLALPMTPTTTLRRLPPASVLPVGAHAGIGVAVGYVEAKTVAIGARRDDGGHILAARGQAPVDGQKKQLAVFDRGHRVISAARCTIQERYVDSLVWSMCGTFTSANALPTTGCKSWALAMVVTISSMVLS